MPTATDPMGQPQLPPPSQVGDTQVGHTVARFFSISDIAGALGDAGQGFKNIDNLLQSIHAPVTFKKKVIGCGEFIEQGSTDGSAKMDA
jgi:hypothetical protein